ncbi:MAG: DUF2442 domain-containing protein [Nitrospirota bacterium]
MTSLSKLLLPSSADARIGDVKATGDSITAFLVDGRVISVPLAWSWRLSEATPAQRANFEVIGDGQGVHWPEIDEDVSAEGMLHGVPAPRPRKPERLVGVPRKSPTRVMPGR